jgi:hypothetical protein
VLLCSLLGLNSVYEGNTRCPAKNA